MFKKVQQEQIQAITCHRCDKTFFHAEMKEIVCPKCGATGSKWIFHDYNYPDEEEVVDKPDESEEKPAQI